MLPTLKYMFCGIRNKIYHRTNTVFLELLLSDADVGKTAVADQLYFRVFTESNTELKKIKFPKLFLLPVDRWLTQGSKLIIGYYKDQAVSYAWDHRNSYQIHGTGTVVLKAGEIWIGPVFVHKSARSMGINTKQIRYLLTLEKQNGIKRCLTCVSSKNFASLKSFTKNGFQVLGKHQKVSGIFRFLKPEPINHTFLDRVEIYHEDFSADS